MPYSARNLSSSHGRHVHEGEVELMPGDEFVITKAAVCAKLKDVEITSKNDQMLPGFHQDTVTVNGKKPANLTAAIVESIIATGSATLKNTGDKKSLVAMRLTVVEIEKPKQKQSQDLAPAESDE